MPGIKCIALTFFALRKSAHAAVFTQVIESCPAPGQQLVRICLVPHVPDQLVLRQVKGQMQGHRKLHNAQIGGQMPACPADLFNQELTDLLRQQIQVLRL